jgi:hypothetical protein
MDSARLQPALLGGIFIGVFSALPIINAGNCCCCLWVLAGGALSVYLYQQNAPSAVTAADGALLGLLAGAIGGVIWAVLSIPIHMFLGPMQAEWLNQMMAANQDMPPEAREMFERMTSGGAIQLIGALINFVASVVFGMLGGLLGVAIFKKNVPPPQNPTVIPHDPGTAR